MEDFLGYFPLSYTKIASMKNTPQANLSLQVNPINEKNAYPIIDEAIRVIQDSGLRYRVQPFSTIVEGALSELIDEMLAAKEAALAAGGDELVLNIQIHLKKSGDVSFEDKTAKFE